MGARAMIRSLRKRTFCLIQRYSTREVSWEIAILVLFCVLTRAVHAGEAESSDARDRRATALGSNAPRRAAGSAPGGKQHWVTRPIPITDGVKNIIPSPLFATMHETHYGQPALKALKDATPDSPDSVAIKVFRAILDSDEATFRDLCVAEEQKDAAGEIGFHRRIMAATEPILDYRVDLGGLSMYMYRAPASEFGEGQIVLRKENTDYRQTTNAISDPIVMVAMITYHAVNLNRELFAPVNGIAFQHTWSMMPLYGEKKVNDVSLSIERSYALDIVIGSGGTLPAKIPGCPSDIHTALDVDNDLWNRMSSSKYPDAGKLLESAGRARLDKLLKRDPKQLDELSDRTRRVRCVIACKHSIVLLRESLFNFPNGGHASLNEYDVIVKNAGGDSMVFQFLLSNPFSDLMLSDEVLPHLTALYALPQKSTLKKQKPSNGK